MRNEFEQVVVYTDILESILENAYHAGAMQCKSCATFEKLNDESKAYAAEKIQWLREDIASHFMFPHHSIKDWIKESASTPPTTESLETDGFGVAKGK